MNQHDIEKYAQVFEQQGFLFLAEDEIPLSQAQWQALERLVNDVTYQKVVGGDTGDAHSVWVGRFINDVEYPQSLHAETDLLLDVVLSERLRRLFSGMLGASEPCVRRCQANRLKIGDFIGLHVDQDTTPDYHVTAIFQINENYQGGEFILLHPQLGRLTFKLPRRSILINRGDIPHLVNPVTAGERQTLACFLSSHAGATRNPRKPIQISEAY